MDIAEAVFGTVAAGIETFGGVVSVVDDSTGTPQTVKFSRPTLKLVYVTISVVADPDVFAVTGAADIALAIAGVVYPVAKDVTASAVLSRAWVPGVLSVPAFPLIGVTASPSTSADIVCGTHDQAVFDTSRVIVNVTYGSP